MPTEQSSFGRWLDRILKAGPFFAAVKWAAENWQTVLGGGGMIYAAYQTWKDLGLVVWLGTGILSACLIQILTNLAALIKSRAKKTEADAKLAENYSKDVVSFNPKKPQYNGETIAVKDMFGPFTPVVQGKHFADCDFVGPAIVVFMDGITLDECGFVESGDPILLPQGTLLVGAVGFDRCSFRKCRFLRTGIATASTTVVDAMVAMGARDPRKLPLHS